MRLLQSYLKDGQNLYPHYYLSPYLPVSAGRDTISGSLVRFKQRLQPDLNYWIGSAIESLRAIQPDAATIIMRPLRHDETAVRRDFCSALDLLGQTLATHFSCRYLPFLLAKSRPTLPNKYLSRRQRRSELHDVYRLGVPSAIDISPDTPFLLIDDILTTGATMRTIIHILHPPFPLHPIRIFTLTRAANTV